MLLWDAGVRTGRITPERFRRDHAAAPAKLFGLWPRKGAIAEGSDADIVLWTLTGPSRCRRPPITCAWTTASTRAGPSRERRTPCCRAARSSWAGRLLRPPGPGPFSQAGGVIARWPPSGPPHARMPRVLGASRFCSADPQGWVALERGLIVDARRAGGGTGGDDAADRTVYDLRRRGNHARAGQYAHASRALVAPRTHPPGVRLPGLGVRHDARAPPVARRARPGSGAGRP